MTRRTQTLCGLLLVASVLATFAPTQAEKAPPVRFPKKKAVAKPKPNPGPSFSTRFVRRKGRLVERLTASVKGKWYEAWDERYTGRDADGTLSYYNDDWVSGGEVCHLHYYSLAPDSRYLFIERKACHGVCFGYLYRIEPECLTMTPVHTRAGLRLDEAAWEYIRRTQKNVTVPTTSPPAYQGHIIDFHRWSADSKYLYIGLRCAKEKRPPYRQIEYGLRYRVRDGKFKIMSRTYWEN